MRRAEHPAGRVAAIGGALAAVVAFRWAVAGTSALGGIAEGAVFGVLLGCVALAGGYRPARPAFRPLVACLAAGGLGGLALVAISFFARWPLAPLMPGHAGSFVPWAAVTVLVAVTEEIVLRGTWWAAIEDASGPAAALGLTALAFALVHVPLYGWAVVPVDLGAGLVLGGLRLATGGTAAPAAAHVVADLATWWL